MPRLSFLILFFCIIMFGVQSFAQTNEPILIHVNFLVIDDGVTDLTANAVFSDPDDAVGEVAPLLPELFDLNILIILNQIYSQCHITFQLETVKVVRPERIESPLRKGRTLADVFLGEGRARTLELNASTSFLDEFALTTVMQGQEAPFELFVDGPYLTMFVVGAPLTIDGEGGVLAVGQLNGRHSAATYKDFVDINNPTSVETIAHEWGHNLGLLHTDNDGLLDTDGDSGNLMFASVNPTGRGNRRLTASQCAVARTSPLLNVQPRVKQQTVDVPGEFATIQDAISAVAAGGVVRLAQGEYEESVFIDKPLTLIAQIGANVVLRGDPDNNLEALNIDNAANVVVEGITILGKGVFVRNGIDVILKNNRIADGDIGLFILNTRARIEGNVIEKNRLGVVVLVSEVTLLDNKILNNAELNLFVDEESVIFDRSNNVIRGNGCTSNVPDACVT